MIYYCMNPLLKDQAPSINDKIVLNRYKYSIQNIGGRYEIELPFKKENGNLPNNRSYAFNHMIKLEQRFKKYNVLKNNYFSFMGELLNKGHAVIVDPADDVPSGKV